MSRPRVLVVGVGRRSAGGVWAVLSTLLGSSLARSFALTHVATHRDGSGADKLIAAARGIARVAGILLARQADLVWVHTSADFSFRRKSVVVGLCRLFRMPCVLHVHGSSVEGYYRDAPPPEQAMVRAVLRAADLVIALSPARERQLQAITPCRTASVFNPVVIPPPADDDRRVAGRIVTFGRLGERKGSKVLVSAVAALATAHPEAHVILAGDGDHEGVIRHAHRLEIADRVEVRRWIPPEEVGRLLDSASAFALPSRDEGLPVALLEAMAHALPVVVTPVGGIPDLVEEGVHGYLVPPDDPDALSEALGRILDDPAHGRTLGRAGRREVECAAAVPVVVKELEVLLRRTLAQAAGRRL